MSTRLSASACGPLDLAHLERMTMGERGLAREVLLLFLKQTHGLVDALEGRSAEAGTLSHTLKGSARAIGAFHVADSAAALECAARDGGDFAAELAALRIAVADAQAAIEDMLRG